MTSLEAIATKMGMSRRTVSRYMNQSGYVSEKNKKKLAALFAKTPYVPNALGARLARAQAPVVGVMFPPIASPNDHYLLSVMMGVWKAAQQHRFQVLVFHQHPYDFGECLRLVKSKEVGGLLLTAPSHRDTATLQEMRKTVPLVVLHSRIPGVDSVFCDNRKGAALAVQHLIDQGRRRIAFLHGKDEWIDAAERYDGYRAALKSAGLPFDATRVAYGHYSHGGGAEGLKNLLARHPDLDAVFSANDEMMFGALRVLKETRRSVPGEVALVGFDDHPACRTPLLAPPAGDLGLSSVAQPFTEMAETATLRLIDLQQSTDTKKSPWARAFPPQLHVRGSSAIFTKRSVS